MTDFPPNPEDGEFWLPSDIVSEITSSHSERQKNAHPAAASANTNITHATHFLVQPNASVDRSLPNYATPNAKVCIGFSGRSINPNEMGFGRGVPPTVHIPCAAWNGGHLHFQPFIPGPPQEIYSYPEVQYQPASGPVDVYDYPISMFARSRSQDSRSASESMAKQQNFPSLPLQINKKKVRGSCAAKCGGTGVFLPNKEISYRNKSKETGRDEVPLNPQIVSSTGKKKKSGKNVQRNQLSTVKEDNSKEEPLLPPGISLPEEWTY